MLIFRQILAGKEMCLLGISRERRDSLSSTDQVFSPDSVIEDCVMSPDVSQFTTNQRGVTGPTDFSQVLDHIRGSDSPSVTPSSDGQSEVTSQGQTCVLSGIITQSEGQNTDVLDPALEKSGSQILAENLDVPCVTPNRMLNQEVSTGPCEISEPIKVTEDQPEVKGQYQEKNISDPEVMNTNSLISEASANDNMDDTVHVDVGSDEFEFRGEAGVMFIDSQSTSWTGPSDQDTSVHSDSTVDIVSPNRNTDAIVDEMKINTDLIRADLELTCSPPNHDTDPIVSSDHVTIDTDLISADLELTRSPPNHETGCAVSSEHVTIDTNLIRADPELTSSSCDFNQGALSGDNRPIDLAAIDSDCSRDVVVVQSSSKFVKSGKFPVLKVRDGAIKRLVRSQEDTLDAPCTVVNPSDVSDPGSLQERVPDLAECLESSSDLNSSAVTETSWTTQGDIASMSTSSSGSSCATLVSSHGTNTSEDTLVSSSHSVATSGMSCDLTNSVVLDEDTSQHADTDNKMDIQIRCDSAVESVVDETTTKETAVSEQAPLDWTR